ncbi:hypothetical protein KM043_003958 [Ampulex compressa]|nr:hypothetical protein KM043_003958 [Ampulex compressa]
MKRITAPADDARRDLAFERRTEREEETGIFTTLAITSRWVSFIGSRGRTKHFPTLFSPIYGRAITGVNVSGPRRARFDVGSPVLETTRATRPESWRALINRQATKNAGSMDTALGSPAGAAYEEEGNWRRRKKRKGRAARGPAVGPVFLTEFTNYGTGAIAGVAGVVSAAWMRKGVT